MLLEVLNMIAQSSQPKSLKDVPDMILSLSEEEKMTEVIHDIYEEYQVFMQTTDMPEYQIHFKSKNKSRFSRSLDMACVEYEQGIYHLYISDDVYNSNIRKEILFHEFTHIYDREYLYNKYRFGRDGRMADINTHPFTEIHAEQVRFLYMLGCKDVNDTPKGVDHNTIVYDINGKQFTFYNYFEEIRRGTIDKVFVQGVESVKRQGKKTSKDAIRNVVDQLLYYIGALGIYTKYCNYKNDELMDLSNVADCWYVEIDKVIDLYCNNDINTLQKIDIVKKSEIMMCGFVRGAEKIGIL